MAVYAAIQGGVITNFIDWDGVTPYTPPGGVTLTLASTLTGVCMIGSTMIGNAGSAPAPVVQTQNLTFQQFCSLFTAAEFTAIVAQAISTPVSLAGLFKTISYSGGPNMDLNGPYMAAAAAYLVTNSLITPARATQMLAGVVMNPQA